MVTGEIEKQALAIQELGYTIVFDFNWFMSIRGTPSADYAALFRCRWERCPNIASTVTCYLIVQPLLRVAPATPKPTRRPARPPPPYPCAARRLKYLSNVLTLSTKVRY
jgi:hypothetical protein